MTLSEHQLATYQRDGVVVLPDLFSPAEVDAMLAEVESLAGRSLPSHVREKEGGPLRAMHGCHLDSGLFDRLVRQPRFVGIAQQVLGPRVYLHQFKINLKAAFTGEGWQWHQDYIFWLKEDGMPRPLPFNLAILLDDVSELNGPLYFIPTTHRLGTIDLLPAVQGDGWQTNFGAALPYATPDALVAREAERHGIVVPKGKRGSVLMFHSNILHGSPSNISPSPRRLVILTYNDVDNPPVKTGKTRPEFLVTHDVHPLAAVDVPLIQ